MTFDGDTIVLDQDDVADCVVKEMTRRGLAEPGRPYYVRFMFGRRARSSSSSAALSIVVTIEPREHA